jgi:hypothetical protein
MNILEVKVNLKNKSELTNMPQERWYDSKAFIEKALEQMFKDADFAKQMIESDYVIMGVPGYRGNWSLLKVTSPTEFEDVTDGNFLKDHYDNMREVLKKPHLTFDYDNVDIEKSFSVKYPELFNNLNDRYNSVERGGNMVDFHGDKVRYSHWDHKDQSGYTETVCTISDLMKEHTVTF